MTVATLTHDDDAQLDRYGYRQQFVRSLRHFESFAVAFSFISITTGIFTTFAFVLATGGPRGIIPDRPVRLGANWTGNANPGGGPVTVRLA